MLAVTFITSGLSILFNVRKLNCQSVKAFNTLCRGTISRRAISLMLPQSGVDVSQCVLRRLMKECGLTSHPLVKQRYRLNADNNRILLNLLKRQFNQPNQIASDGVN